MNLFLVKYPKILKWLYPARISRLDAPKTLFLTFDDGPIPEITPWVLKELKKYQGKATFFCIGDNVKKHPDIFQQIISEGHQVGNHTFNHLNGWHTSKENYLENVNMAEAVMFEANFNEKEKKKRLKSKEAGNENRESRKKKQETRKLFRPPYGKIKNSQAKALVKYGYEIVMWDILSGDFSKKISPEKCYTNVIKNSKEGSVIVFHDSLKASKNLKYVLPRILEYYSEKGFQFKSL